MAVHPAVPGLMEMLVCPFSAEPLQVEDVVEGTERAVEVGILRSTAFRFPVLAGIPILKEDAATAGLVRLIESGRHREALLTLLSPPMPPSRRRRVAQFLRRWGPSRRLGEATLKAAEARWRRRTEMAIQGQPTARELFAHWHLTPGRERPGFDYFWYRFTQPRHLAGLAVGTLIADGPVLDIACGAGHLTRFLQKRARPQRVIGIDHSFYHLYIARTLVAPDGDFVCGKVDASLPFATGRFAFAFCSDAFHYFIGKAGCARELERVTAAHGTIALVTVRSARAHHLSPGIPLTPAGYAALFSDRPCRLVPEDDVWRRYLEGLGPALERGVPEERLDRAPVLTCVTTGNAGIFRDHGPFGPWPHGAGHLGLNPLYRVTASNAHTVTLARTYPSAYYEEENRDSLSYLPEMVTVTRDGITALERQERTPEVERLVERFVAIDLPPRWS